MEESELKVIELKRWMLANKLKMDKKDLASLMDYDLVTPELVAKMKVM